MLRNDAAAHSRHRAGRATARPSQRHGHTRNDDRFRSEHHRVGAAGRHPGSVCAAIAVGVAGVFMETHPDPAKALSDGPNAVPLKHMKALLEQLVSLDRVVKAQPLLENDFSC